VGGGAYAYGKHRERTQQDAADQSYSEGQQAQTATVAPASTGITAEDTARLAELGKLHDQGVLTDEEFSQEKAKILGI
jgi:hypothetical protein